MSAAVAPARQSSWLDPKWMVPLGLQTLALMLVGASWKTGVDKDIVALTENVAKLEQAQSALTLLTGNHEGRIVRVETQVVAIDRMEAKLDRLLRFMPPEQRGSAGVLPATRLP